LNEYQIEKVVSWMSVNEDNFSDFEFAIAGASHSDGKANEKSKSDSTYQDIVNIIKEIEHDKKDAESFKNLKTDVEFKLNTILNSMESPTLDGDCSIIECNDGGMDNGNKIK
jgi:hypothetical protein